MVWFVYELERGSFWTRWIRESTEPISTFMIWITRIISAFVKKPYVKYKQSLHLQRNIFWYLGIFHSMPYLADFTHQRALGIDRRVARLNLTILEDDGFCSWPSPYWPSKLIRDVTYPVKLCILGTRKFLRAIWHCVMKCFAVMKCFSRPRKGPANQDLQSRELESQEKAEPLQNEETPETPEQVSKNLYRSSLQSVFGEEEIVQTVIDSIGYWEHGG